MKNKKKKSWIITLIIILILSIGVGCFLYYINSSNKLTLEESKWIDSNKYNMIDVALMNDIPIISYDGIGVAYDFLTYVEEKHSLKFNVITYKLDGTATYDYYMNIVDTPSKNDIVLLEDNLALVTKDAKEYTSIDQIKNLKLGVLNSDKEKLENILKEKNIEFTGYDNYADLKNSITSEDSTLDGIIIAKTLFTKELIDKDYKISYHFADLYKYYVLKLGKTKELNGILTKDYAEFNKEKYEESYNETLLNNYYTFKQVTDIDQKKLQSKSYTYGFIEYGIYNNLNKDEFAGLSEIILKDFAKFSNLSLSYTKYNSVGKLINDFNSNKVDFTLNIINDKKYKNDVYKTSGVFNKNLVAITNTTNQISIDGIYSLKNKEVLVIKNTLVEKYLFDNDIKVKSYNNLTDMLKDFKSNSIIILDMENYNYYKTTKLKNTRINYYLDLNGKYNYVINDTNANKQFEDLFNFYLNYTNINKVIDTNYNSAAYNTTNITYILIILLVIFLIYIVVDFNMHIKLMFGKIKKEKKVHLSKEEKVKYIDQLTSLKNRAYLNSRIEEWDNSLVYPQSIIIVDLNNIAYINDNYGREEGDKVITEAANILMQNQLQNSEIIRTDGNEFLLYLVGYDEKQVVSYLRKLNKEFKTLSHGFGAASGYSIITDEIKTVDDAVNEATLDMKNNKEDIDY